MLAEKECVRGASRLTKERGALDALPAVADREGEGGLSMTARICGGSGVVDPAVLGGVEGGLGAVSKAKLAQDAGYVVLDRAFGDEELPGDLAVREAAGYELQHLELAL